MTRVRMTVCNRCGHSDKEEAFEGMDVGIYDQGGSGTNEDSFTLRDPCTDALRKWISTKPDSAAKGKPRAAR